MDEKPQPRPEPKPEGSQPRRYIYRSAVPEPDKSNPMRRSTDAPRLFRGVGPTLLKMRVYMKIN